MMHFVLYCATEDTSVCVSMREDASGRRTYLDGEVIHKDGTHSTVAVVDVKPVFVPGARMYESVSARVVSEDGREFTIQATPLLEPWAYAGTGYDGGYSDKRGLGVPRGHLAEHDVYDLAPPEAVLLEGEPTPSGHREQFAKVVVGGVETTGYCTIMTRGSLPRFGLD
jgi:hypothetical protein